MKLHQRFMKQFEDEYGFAGDEQGYAGGDITKGGNSGTWGRKNGREVGRKQFKKNEQAQTQIQVTNYTTRNINFEFFNANNSCAKTPNPERYRDFSGQTVLPLDLRTVVGYSTEFNNPSANVLPVGLWFFDKNKDLVFVDKIDQTGNAVTMSNFVDYLRTGLDTNNIVSLRISMSGQGNLSYERFLNKLDTTSFYVNKIIITTSNDILFQSSIAAREFSLLEEEKLDGFSLQSANSELIQNTNTRTYAEGKQAQLPITVDSNYALYAVAPPATISGATTVPSVTTWLLFFDTIFDHTRSLDV